MPVVMSQSALETLSDLTETAHARLQEQYADINPMVRRRSAMREMGITAAMINVDCPRMRGRMLLILHDEYPDSLLISSPTWTRKQAMIFSRWRSTRSQWISFLPGCGRILPRSDCGCGPANRKAQNAQVTAILPNDSDRSRIRVCAVDARRVSVT
jgi:hypothetical protein